jgi:hypothetical protein
MIGKITLYLTICLAIGLSGIAGADDLDNRIRAAGSDIKIFCPATDAKNIQWTALLYLSQTYGAEIYIALFQPSPLFACKVKSTDDKQFHLARIGLGVGTDEATLIDSSIACIFGGDYPDLAVFDASSAEDSSWLSWVLTKIRQRSQADTSALSTLEKIYVRGWKEDGTAVILNDEELHREYRHKAEEISKAFGTAGPMHYTPERFRRYFSITSSPPGKPEFNDLLYGTGLDPFRLPRIVEESLSNSPEKKNVMRRLEGYQAAIGTAQQPWHSRLEKLKLLLSAYADILALESMAHDASSHLAESGAGPLIEKTRSKAFQAIRAAIGIDWRGRLELRDTPFGKTGKLSLDVELNGPRKIELSYFRFHPSGAEPIIIDSISKTIEPHQRFIREYQIDVSKLDISEMYGDSLLFSVAVIVEGLTLNLYLPLSDYAEEDVAIRFLPGYTFLKPFTQDQYTALAQPFDWQIQITKPYASELTGRFKIHNPDGIVVGSFDDRIFMPEGVTSKYFDIHFAAGRSIGYDVRRIGATLEVGGQRIAEAGGEVGVIRCQIPETRDIAFIPDSDGRLEDFLRIARVSFHPFTPRSMIRATLDAYDLLVIGADVEDYYDVLSQVGDRLHEFVRNGGDILILGQSFGWPHDIFDISIFSSKSASFAPAQIRDKSHAIFKEPYEINTSRFLASAKATGQVWPALINGGTEIISAGELGSYLTVFKIGDGYVIYCGLPLLEMAEKLDVETIHLTANILNFGHGN